MENPLWRPLMAKAEKRRLLTRQFKLSFVCHAFSIIFVINAIVSSCFRNKHLHTSWTTDDDK